MQYIIVVSYSVQCSYADCIVTFDTYAAKPQAFATCEQGNYSVNVGVLL